jgi:hypothetical protein
VLWRRVADDIVVLLPGDSDPAVLSAAAAVVWNDLETSASVTELAGSLALALERDPGAMRADLEPILDELERLGLLLIEDPADLADV